MYIRTLLRTLQAGIKNTNPLIKKLSRLLSRNLGSFIGVSTVGRNRKIIQITNHKTLKVTSANSSKAIIEEASNPYKSHKHMKVL